MFARRYFPSRYFPQTYFPHGATRQPGFVPVGAAVLVASPEAGSASLSSRILHGSAAFDPKPAAGAVEMGLVPRAGSAAYDRPEPGSAGLRSP